LSKGVVMALSGVSASALGFAAHFGLAGLISLLGVLVALGVSRQRSET